MEEEKEINVLRHIFIPKHNKLSDEEKQKLLEKYNISVSQLPSIYQSDPVIKKLNAVPGEVIKIIRSSQTSTEATFYRVVIYG